MPWRAEQERSSRLEGDTHRAVVSQAGFSHSVPFVREEERFDSAFHLSPRSRGDREREREREKESFNFPFIPERLKDMPETERQSIVRLTRESEAKEAEATARENARPSAGGTNDSDIVKQAEGSGPPDFSSDSSDSSSDESDYSIPADGGGGIHPPTWNLSVKRILGARVYARYVNGQWYWGNIVRVRGSYREKNLRFRVLFEDGDDLDDLPSIYLVTEKEYSSENREGEERYPPYPKPKRRRLKTLLDEAKGIGNQPTAEGNGKVAAAASASSPAAMSVTAAILQSNITVSPPAKKQRQDLESNAAATAIAVPMEVQLANRPGAQTDAKVSEAPDAPITTSNHFLVGKGFASEWTDVYGQNKIVYGTIVKMVDVDLFEVRYSEASRKALLLMSKKSLFGSPIPETQKIREDAAWGGAACFERKMLLRRGPDSVTRNLTRDKPCVTVIVPDTRHQTLVEYNGRQVPELTLTVRGFKLVFSVKKSTIPGAGLGVFVKCTSFRKKTGEGPETFELMAGELLDIGVYAPLTANDKKHSHVFNCKTYAFSMRTEQYSFDSPEDGYLFDISDDQTGEPHETARHHLPMYVNETVLGTETIHAENDPEGNVHYMFGLRYDGDFPAFVKDAKTQLALQADGKTEKELFVHYGETYEEVRISQSLDIPLCPIDQFLRFLSNITLREGYSIKTQKEQKAVLRRAAQHQREFVLAVFTYPPESLERCVDFFLTKLIPEHLYGQGGQGNFIDAELRDRALHMSRMFRIRGERILDTVTRNKEMAAESVASPTATAKQRYDPTEGIDMENLMSKINSLIERLNRLSCLRAVPPFTKEMERQLITEAEEFHNTPSDDGYKIESETDSDEDNANADDSDSSYEE